MDWNTPERELERKFGKYGKIERCVLIWNHRERRSKGFGFVTFYEIEDAIAAVEGMNGRTLDGREVRVDFSYTKEGKLRDAPRRSRSRSRSRSPARRSRRKSRSHSRSRSRDRR